MATGMVTKQSVAKARKTSMAIQEQLFPHDGAYANTILAMREWTPEVPENGLMSLMLTMPTAGASRRDLFLLCVGMKQIVNGFKAIGETIPLEIIERYHEVRLAFEMHE